MSFLNSIENKSTKFEKPFAHWELNEPLTEGQINEIANTDIANPLEYNLNYDGTRAIDGGEGKFREGISSGGKALKFRCFITKENSSKFPELTKFIKAHDVASIKSGFLGNVSLDKDAINELAKIPSKDILLGKVVGGGFPAAA